MGAECGGHCKGVSARSGGACIALFVSFVSSFVALFVRVAWNFVVGQWLVRQTCGNAARDGVIFLVCVVGVKRAGLPVLP